MSAVGKNHDAIGRSAHRGVQLWNDSYQTQQTMLILEDYINLKSRTRSVRSICLDVVNDIRLLLNYFGLPRQRHSGRFTLKAPLIRTLTETCPPSWYREGHRLFFNVIVFNRCPYSPWIRQLVSRAWSVHDIWHSNNSHSNKSPSEKSHEPWTKQYFQ